MVVDTSVIVGILRLEDDAENLARTIACADRPRVSTASLVEALIVLDGRSGDDNGDLLRDAVRELGLEVEPVTIDQVWLAGEAYRRFGKGHHPAKLNFGDCFAYALAKELDLPLLFKGDDFRQTDIRPAL